MIQILVLLEVKDKSASKAYETKAIQVMKKYGGKLLAAFEPDVNESSKNNIGEIHYLEFPSIDSFKNYRTDLEVLRMKELREKAILSTTVYVSGKQITYD